MKTTLQILGSLLTLFAIAGFASAQDSQLESQVEQAKKLSALTGRPMLAVAGEAAN